MTEYEKRIGVEFARECFELRGTEVYWRDRPVTHFSSEHAWKVFQTKYAGKPAGRREHNGYVAIHMRHKGIRLQFQAHRVIWMLHHGAWPERVIDHMNRTRGDNRIENLRDVPAAANAKNAANKRVYPYVAEHKWGGFHAQVRVSDTNVHLGIFDTEDEARAHREAVCGELQKLARSLAKKSKTGRKRKGHQTNSQDTPIGGNDVE